MDATSSGSSMGATLFFGLTAAALITHTPPEVTYISPIETMGQAPFEGGLQPADRPVALDAVRARPGLRQHRELQVAVVATTAPTLAGLPQAQTGSATVTDIGLQAPNAPTATQTVPRLEHQRDVPDLDPRIQRGAQVATITERPAVTRVVGVPERPQAKVASVATPQSPKHVAKLVVDRLAIGSDRRLDAQIRSRSLAEESQPRIPLTAKARSVPAVSAFGVVTAQTIAQTPPPSINVPFNAPEQIPPLERLGVVAVDAWQTPLPPPIAAQVTGDSVYLRRGPGIEFEPITQFDAGTGALILETRARWRRVEIGDQTGWMFGGYLARAPGP